MADPVACVDFGSTFTKATLVDVGTGEVLASAAHRTTVEGDVLEGWEACRAVLAAADARARDAEVLACSSAGGGLRVGVVGNEELVTAEAGRRVALSSGGRVVHVVGGGLDADRLAALRVAAPDVVLLVGGTDGGNGEVLLSCATELARAWWPGPVVVAGNRDVQDEVAALLAAAGTPCTLAGNVVPRIGSLVPEPARAAIREVFLRHVIGGKHLSARADFAAMVRGATPDVVLTAVELLAGRVGDVVVVDVGGATTDVHSVLRPDPEEAGLSRTVVAAHPVARTVEGDLGMRWSAPSTLVAARAAGLLPAQDAALTAAATARARSAGLLLSDPAETELDERIAGAAVGVALRRHAGRSRVVYGEDGRVLERSGRDLREVDLLVGSGGVLRHNPVALAARVLGSVTGGDVPGGWQLPRDPRVVVDRDYVLAPAGLLATRYPDAALALLDRLRGEDLRGPGVAGPSLGA